MEATSNGKSCSTAREWVDAYIDAYLKLAKSELERRASSSAPVPCDTDSRDRCAPR